MKLIVDTNNLYRSTQRAYGRLLDYVKYVDAAPEPVTSKLAYVSGYGEPQRFINFLTSLGFEVRVKGGKGDNAINFNVELAVHLLTEDGPLILGTGDAAISPALKLCKHPVTLYGCCLAKALRTDARCVEITKEVLYASSRNGDAA